MGTKGEVSTRTLNAKKLRIWGGGSLKKVIKQGPKIEPPKIEITANLIHWQVEEKEKKKTEELFKMEEKKKEREKAAATQMPLVWDGAEWVFEDEHAKRKEEARIKREEAALAEAERKRLAKEEEERRKKEEALKADAKLKADAAKFLEEQEQAKKIQKETVTVRAGAGAKVDMFEKGDGGKEKVK